MTIKTKNSILVSKDLVTMLICFFLFACTFYVKIHHRHVEKHPSPYFFFCIHYLLLAHKNILYVWCTKWKTQYFILDMIIREKPPEKQPYHCRQRVLSISFYLLFYIQLHCTTHFNEETCAAHHRKVILLNIPF